MQNKGYSTPYGSTVVPNAPNIVEGNGIPGPDFGAAGGRSVIPGTIGVAGPRARGGRVESSNGYALDESPAQARIARGLEPGHPGFRGNYDLAQPGASYKSPEQPRIPSMAEAMGQGALDGIVNMIVDKIADRLAPRIADLVAARVFEALGALGQQALDTGAVVVSQPKPEPVHVGRYDKHGSPLSRGIEFKPEASPAVNPPAMVAGSAAGVRELVETGIKTAATNAVGISPEQVEAYSRAHHELEEAVSFYGSATVGEGSVGFELLRRAPEPPVFALTARNGVRSEWCAYSAAYDQPRFRLPMSPGVLPADRFLVTLDGKKLGFVIKLQLLQAMAEWLSDNIEPVQAHGRDDSDSALNTID